MIDNVEYASRDEALADGVPWSYGYANNPEFIKEFERQVPADYQQYDVEMFFFLNYVPNDKLGHNGFPTDITRDQHWWRAAERRWPSLEDDRGRLIGEFERDDWSERLIRAAAKHNTVNVLGGSGQGKTTTAIAFGITVWDYFAHTVGGARLQFSSVDEGKVRGAAWAMCRKLYTHSNKDCSPNICKGLIFPGVMEIRRKGSQFSEQGIIRAVLVRDDSTAEERVDKLTGTHDPEAQILLTDEAQKSPEALSIAGKNLRTHAKFFWEWRSGNPNRPDDYLGKSAKPIDGWESVDPNRIEDPPLEWATSYQGTPGWAIRFNNDNSPGMDDPVRYWYRPTLATKDEIYPDHTSRGTVAYKRFWEGWMVPEAVDDTLIKMGVIEEMGCHAFANINRGADILNFMSFDPAPESLDRNPLGRFQICYEGNKMILNIAQIWLMPPMNPSTFERQSRDYILEKAQEWQVRSGDLIMDYTQHVGTKAMLQEEGFNVVGLCYSDGASNHPIEKHAVKKASEIYANVITEAAYLFEALIRNGQVRGLNEHVIPKIREELCLRRIVAQQQSGKIKLEAKGGPSGFRKKHGFSPDIFDICCQAAWFAREKFGLIPGIDKHFKSNNIPKSEKSRSGGWNRKYL